MNDTIEALSPERLAAIAARAAEVTREVSRVFVGAPEVAELLLVTLFARGHVLLEGVPGVAKTTLAKAFASTLRCEFKRVQFTPDLLPADITGTYVHSPNDGTWKLREGPVFANVLLADEINRAPAKTQSALLEAMQEFQTTIDGETRKLPSPFIVIATQNPVEQAGTYPLPEAQIDRFLMRLVIGYPNARDEELMLRRFTTGTPEVRPMLRPEEILFAQQLVKAVHVEDAILDFVVRLCEFTRRHGMVFLGASPRAGLALVQASMAQALVHGRPFVLPDDIKRLAPAVLCHRMVLTPEAQMEGITGERVVREALEKVGHRREARR
jgi:MoxR-like ATPase